MKYSLHAILLWSMTNLAWASPEDVTRFYEDALGYFNKEEYNTAVIQLKNALQSAPSYLPARILLGEALLKQGDGAGAEKEIRLAQKNGAAPSLTVLTLAKALSLQKKYAALIEQIPASGLPEDQKLEILFQRGKAYLELGQHDEARMAFEQALQIPGGSRVLPTVGLAMLALKQQRLQQADSIADQALRYDPNHPETWHAKGAIAYAGGDLKLAAAHYTRCLELAPEYYTARISRASVYIELGQHEDALKELKELAETAEWDPQVNYYLAVVRRKLGDLQGARDALQHASGLINAADYEKLLESPHLLMIGGLINYSNGELENAHRFLSDYIKEDRNNLIAFKLLGATLLAMQEPMKAIPVWQRATELNPNAAHLHQRLAESYFQAGRYRKAIASLQTADRLVPGRPDTSLRLGVTHLAASDRKQSIQELEAAFLEDPDSTQSAQILSAVQLSAGNPQRVIEILAPLSERQPNNHTAVNMLATAYLQLGQPTQARNLYETALTIKPGFRPAIINLAQLDLRQNQPDRARRALGELLANEPENPRLLYELAKVEKAVGSRDAAIRLLEKAYEFDRTARYVAFRLIDYYIEAGNPNRALEIARHLRIEEPDNLKVHQTMGQVQLAQGDPAAARVAFNNAAKLAGFDAEALYRVAQWQLRADATDEARWSLQKAINGDPNFLPALMALVALELRMDKLESAAGLIDRLVKQAATHPAVNRLRGDLAFKMREYKQAIGFYGQALQQQDDPSLAFRRFQARNAAGDTAKALQELANWVKRHPKGVVAKVALAETYHANGQWQQAQAHYEELLQLGWENAALFNNLANLYAEIGDQRALEFAFKAYEMAPTHPNIIDTLGWLLVTTAQIEKGLGYLRDASSRSPEQAEIHYHLAVALDELGRQDEAKQELQLALRLKDNFPGSEDARRRLDFLEKR